MIGGIFILLKTFAIHSKEMVLLKFLGVVEYRKVM